MKLLNREVEKIIFLVPKQWMMIHLKKQRKLWTSTSEELISFFFFLIWDLQCIRIKHFGNVGICGLMLKIKLVIEIKRKFTKQYINQTSRVKIGLCSPVVAPPWNIFLNALKPPCECFRTPPNLMVDAMLRCRLAKLFPIMTFNRKNFMRRNNNDGGERWEIRSASWSFL